MTTNLKKWGNSQGIRIPKSVLDAVNWKEDEEIQIFVEEGKVILKKAKENRKNIKELFENYKGQYDKQNIDWGNSVGKEIW